MDVEHMGMNLFCFHRYLFKKPVSDSHENVGFWTWDFLSHPFSVCATFIVLEISTDLCEIVKDFHEGWVMVFLFSKFLQKVLFSWWCRNLLKSSRNTYSVMTF
jgi:hypothetical protein